MGDFNINITATGGHGCDRKAKEGESLKPCQSESCPDCMTRVFVKSLRDKGMLSFPSTNKAELTHWPGQAGQVVDDLMNETRKSGQF